MEMISDFIIERVRCIFRCILFVFGRCVWGVLQYDIVK
ncbi:hypothetical protein HHE02_13000 [Helicobacter heilmannii]|uniref:Uncharacterized protein n=1 Tax=Helicobacter heilmannii TaxID=35817 RepID=A0A0K2XN60_HELHE|nr:hypothetical protein BN341_7140 [Helicobacter heilmannii ASB1.4]CRF46187.1 hypothetical protein HHE014_11810 [Helicobacter heilmannii]CRF47998.1 hypothetical protein HHE02_13000 [Helicobacter heilmannii]CRF49886.1 hypothetical protein HHE03_15640 [Helicobacter heilmannii]CRF51197.1 hypothetical protein HHE06_10580 [Helicobacter heilmannii]